ALGRRCRSIPCEQGMLRHCWRGFRSCKRKRWRGRGNLFRSSPSRKRGWTVSGFIACWSGKESKATSSIRPRLRRPAGGGTLELPFWIFRFDELADVVLSGRRPHPDERDALYELIRVARAKYLADVRSS